MGLTLILIIIFYPNGDKPNLDGSWNIKYILLGNEEVINDKISNDSSDVMFAPFRTMTVQRNSFLLNIEKHKPINGLFKLIHKDTVILFSDFYRRYNSKYYIQIDTLKSTSNELEVNVTLLSPDKIILLYKSVDLAARRRWLREMNKLPKPRGTP